MTRICHRFRATSVSVFAVSDHTSSHRLGSHGLPHVMATGFPFYIHKPSRARFSAEIHDNHHPRRRDHYEASEITDGHLC